MAKAVSHLELMPNEIFVHIDKNKDLFVGKLRTLCQQPSVSAQSLGLVETANLVASFLKEIGFTVETFSPTNGPPVVFGEISSKREGKTLLVYNHYDVQPVDPVELWTHPPFSAMIVDNKVYARGASDNKGNIVSRLMAIDAILKVMGDAPCNIKWVIEGEEEIGSPHFAEFITHYRTRLNADSAIWEFGGLDYDDHPLVTLGLKGMLYVEFKVQTALKDSHSARAAVVENPAWRLVRMLDTIQDEDGRILVEGWYDDVKGFTSDELEVIRTMPLEEHSIRDELGIKHFLYGLTGFEFKKAFYGNPTANIAGIWSGYTGPGHKTVLPSVAHAKMDFRLVPNQDPVKLAGKLKQHLEKHGFGDVEVKLQAENPAARTSIDSPIAKIAAKSGKEVFNKEPVTLVTSAASGPMHFFTNTLKLPTVAIGCNHPRSNTHAPDENQRIDVFVQGSKWIAKVIDDFAKQ
ncbi:MAG TPA: M20/M25/M40 family metallo-hydrolase [Candidatus Dormibacteraeota bacterium]|jgi:acetylornithine deacetylase/succinyl-diaminopimelate desuccinylase-like protein|nr:M20/M25/M40 family metallo-hydrolase [Candidatus Dormibacteraeota bacterium]